MIREQLAEIKKRFYYFSLMRAESNEQIIDDLAWLIEQVERVEKLERLYRSALENYHMQHEEIEAMRDVIINFRETLEFYANADNYETPSGVYHVGTTLPEKEIMKDKGEIARKELGCIDE